MTPTSPSRERIIAALPLSLFIPGIPVPGGSKKAFYIPSLGRSVITDAAGERNRNWRAVVAHAVQQVWRSPPLNVPLLVGFDFTFPRPKCHFRTGKNAWAMKEDAPKHVIKKPDTTKLIRAAEDALTGILWTDDAIIVQQRGSKAWGERPGLLLTVAEAAEWGPSPLESGDWPWVSNGRRGVASWENGKLRLIGFNEERADCEQINGSFGVRDSQRRRSIDPVRPSRRHGADPGVRQDDDPGSVDYPLPPQGYRVHHEAS